MPSLRKLYYHPLIQYSLAGVIILATVLVMLPSSSIIPFRWSIVYAELLAIVLLGVGLVLFSFGQSRIPAWTALACSAFICLVLRETTDSTIYYSQPKGSGTVFSVAVFNTNNVGTDIRGGVRAMLDTRPSVLLVQELDPTWAKIIRDVVGSDYPYVYERPGMGLDGMGVYSQFPMLDVEQKIIGKQPLVIGQLQFTPRHFDQAYFVSTHPDRVLNSDDLDRSIAHLDTLAGICQSLPQPYFVGGDFNTVNWSEEISDFRNDTGLQDSRHGWRPSLSGGLNFTHTPLDHLFFSDWLHCLDFRSIDHAGITIGVMGRYQTIEPNAQQTKKF